MRDNLYRSATGASTGTLLRSWRNGRASPVGLSPPDEIACGVRSIDVLVRWERRKRVPPILVTVLYDLCTLHGRISVGSSVFARYDIWLEDCVELYTTGRLGVDAVLRGGSVKENRRRTRKQFFHSQRDSPEACRASLSRLIVPGIRSARNYLPIRESLKSDFHSLPPLARRILCLRTCW